MRTKRSFFAGLSLFFALHASSSAQAVVETVLGSALESNINLPGFLPSMKSSEILISRSQYVISYNESRREPNWVAWRVDSSTLGSIKRSNSFEMDSELDNYLQQFPGQPQAVNPTEYRGSCFDRGHQSPSGDHTATVEDNRATFMMSNMIPQTPYLNRVIWEHLENYTRDLVKKSGKIAYVVAGPIFDEDFGAVGPNQDIPVPSKNFKIVYTLDQGQTNQDIDPKTPYVAVIMPNRLEDGSAPTVGAKPCHFVAPKAVSVDDWMKYRTSVDKIEKASGVRLH